MFFATTARTALPRTLRTRPTFPFIVPSHASTCPLALRRPTATSSQWHPSLYRSFHSTKRRQDVFFVALPALKSGLLTVTRFSLVFLPFIFRYKLWKKYKRTSYLLIQIPIFAVCIVFALGLDQSPRTGRWRLLLMSEHEEMAWSRRKHNEILHHDGPLILPPSDSRSERVARVTTRLITALEENDHHIISSATWPPKSQELSRVMNEREAGQAWRGNADRIKDLVPSATARSTFMPYRPVSSNPLKHLESADWNLYVIDSPQINAFALPSKDVFVYTGLLDLLPDDDALLAGILGHEIAHVAQRHSVENLGFLNVAAVAFDVLRAFNFALTISFPMITDSTALFINWINDVVAERAYSRKLEMEADVVGLDIMATAGYDPRAALDLWELMAAVEADAAQTGQAVSMENRFALLRTHPTSQVRQEALERDLPKAMKVWREHLPRIKASLKASSGMTEKAIADNGVAEGKTVLPEGVNPSGAS